MSKGDVSRPVDKVKYDKSYARIFKAPRRKQSKVGTPYRQGVSRP